MRYLEIKDLSVEVEYPVELIKRLLAARGCQRLGTTFLVLVYGFVMGRIMVDMDPYIDRVWLNGKDL